MKTTQVTSLTSAQLRKAATLQDKIEDLQKELAALLGAPAAAASGAAPARKRRKMSAAARKRIADAQRARWAKFRAAAKAK